MHTFKESLEDISIKTTVARLVDHFPESRSVDVTQGSVTFESPCTEGVRRERKTHRDKDKKASKKEKKKGKKENS
jgi:hypothetical protein